MILIMLVVPRKIIAIQRLKVSRGLSHVLQLTSCELAELPAVNRKRSENGYIQIVGHLHMATSKNFV